MTTSSIPGAIAKPKVVRPKRVKAPTVLQMEVTECGAASLKSVMEYHGRIVPLEEARVACGVSRNGSTARNILLAARKYGFKADGFPKPIEKLNKVALPAIVYWNFNHFVVLEGVGAGNKEFYLMDPARGHRVASFEEFDGSYTGITLIIQPGKDFQKGGKKPSLVQALRQRLEGSGWAVFYLVMLTFFLTLLGLVTPVYTRVFVDQFLVAGLASWVTPLLMAMGITIAVVGLGTWLRLHYLLRLETKLALSTSAKFFWHILRLPIEFFTQRQAADISVRVDSNHQVAQLLSNEVAINLFNLVLIVFYIVVMIQYDVVLTVIGVVMASLNMIALRLISRMRVDASAKLLNEQGKFMATAFNGLQIIETLKATGRESDFFARWAGFQAKVSNAEQELGSSTEVLTAIPSVLLSANVALILLVGGLRIIAGHLSFGELLAFQAFILAFLAPVNQLVNLGSRLQTTEGNMNRIDDVLKYPVDRIIEQAAALSDAQSSKLSGKLELKDVTFGYSRLDKPLIKDFTLSLQPGMRVALIGGSGSGKSTIAKLVAGIYEPWAGEILFDGQPRTNIPRTQIKNSVAMVDQDIYLFAGAIRENLTMWDNTIPDSRVIQAAKDAAIHEDITARLSGYDHLVEEAGGNFSGGQKQRLEIARALAHNPTILVMDEATSALDPITEKVIDDNIRRRGCTCLIVAHRLSTIRDCDEIIVLDQGKVVQRGTHNQMIRMDGPYARLIKHDEALRAESQSIFDLIEDGHHGN
jgi:NHLM bacteriocin system ABC transporter peptidase/ATP-binding protein